MILSTNLPGISLAISPAIFPNIYIAIQGIPGSYSEQAARSYFSKFLNLKINFIYTQSFQDLVQALDPDSFSEKQRKSDKNIKKKSGEKLIFGVIPIENSTTGFVKPAQEVLNKNIKKLKLLDQIILPIQHALLAHPSVNHISEIKWARSHPQALAQCANFLKSKQIQAQEFFDTAGAAEALSQATLLDRDGVAAIASKICADIYDLKILEENIQDLKNNQTRFLIIRPFKTNPEPDLKKIKKIKKIKKDSEILNLSQKSILNSAGLINTRVF